MTLIDEMPKTTALAQWYGSNRSLAVEVGRELDGCAWVGVPFAGGMCELLHIKARSILVNDLHRHVINLARVTADPVLGPRLYRELRRMAFHPDVLAEAQANCRSREEVSGGGLFGVAQPRDEDRPDWLRLAWARDYFISSWMSQGGAAGQANEFKKGLSFRMDAGGGDSAVRFQSAISGLPGWRIILSRCTFLTTDALEFIGTVKDQGQHGVYCDPPFPGPGDKYKHRFTDDQHRKLAAVLNTFQRTRCVCRFYDVPLVRELYPKPTWTWRHLEGGKKRTNAAGPEVLLINGKSRRGPLTA